jgi:hypothetical protein
LAPIEENENIQLKARMTMSIATTLSMMVDCERWRLFIEVSTKKLKPRRLDAVERM